MCVCVCFYMSVCLPVCFCRHTSMEGGHLFCLVFLFVVVAGNYTTNTTRSCFSHPDLEVRENHVLVKEQDLEGAKEGRMLLYMIPGDGFRGVSVMATGSKGNTTFWLPANIKVINCFMWSTTTVWSVEVACIHHTSYNFVRCDMKAGVCSFSCERKHKSSDLQSIQVFANGPSKWQYRRPSSSCHIITSAKQTSYHANCYDLFSNVSEITEAPTTSKNPAATLVTSAFPVIGVSISLAVLVVLSMLVLVVVKVVKVKRNVLQRRLNNTEQGSTSSAAVAYHTQRNGLAGVVTGAGEEGRPQSDIYMDVVVEHAEEGRPQSDIYMDVAEEGIYDSIDDEGYIIPNPPVHWSDKKQLL